MLPTHHVPLTDPTLQRAVLVSSGLLPSAHLFISQTAVDGMAFWGRWVVKGLILGTPGGFYL